MGFSGSSFAQEGLKAMTCCDIIGELGDDIWSVVDHYGGLIPFGFKGDLDGE